MKRYKTPQGVDDFIRSFRKEALHSIWNEHGFHSDQEKALDVNVERLREFLLARCDTIRPGPPDKLQVPGMNTLELSDEDFWELINYGVDWTW